MNIIGEHTDYNDGFVLPAAVQLQTRILLTPIPERRLFIESAAYPGVAEFDLDNPDERPRNQWSDYVCGVAVFLLQGGVALRGARLKIESDLPAGAGLSSSAALEVVTALSLLSNSGLHLDSVEVARLCHRVENEFIGVRSGIMDQFASCLGRRDHALLLDCRSLEVRYVRIPEGASMMVCNTMVRHDLASSEYNARRKQCEAGVAALARFLPGIQALRDVTPSQLSRYSAELDPVIYRRCRHVVEENRRVLTAAHALERDDLTECGSLMTESHQSLRLDYEVSCPEIDLMCELALGVQGVYGARMIGGGFGGCVLALVDKKADQTFRSAVANEYERRTSIACKIYECFAADGAGQVE